MLIRLTGSGEAAFSCAIAWRTSCQRASISKSTSPCGKSACRHEFMRAQRR
ncbi:hypothetical protein ACLB1R_24625 [Escherichia coli]